jgi:hypothetical protein
MEREVATGKCLCGSVEFEVSGEPMWVAHCHCHSCRRNTGSAVATFVGFRREQLSYIRGSRKIYASSPGVRRGFCADCGTQLTYEADVCEGEVHLYISTLDNPENYIPSRHVFFEEHIPWFDTKDDLPRYATDGQSSDPFS